MSTVKKWRTIEIMVTQAKAQAEDQTLHGLMATLAEAFTERGLLPGEVLFPFPHLNPKPVPGSKEARNGGFKFYIMVYMTPPRHTTWIINL